MATTLDLADSRGTANIGWLRSRHTFSFADYHNPNRMSFGVLRVINDDVVAPAKGFGTHPHRDMEIITIPLSGALRHRDSMGHEYVIKAGEVQVMSAGTGITHSEFNDSDTEEVSLLQIWVLPKEKGIPPRYDQRELEAATLSNHFQLIVAPLNGKHHDVIKINQDAYFSIALIDAEQSIEYTKYQENNGLYFFVIEGSINIGTQALAKRDGIGITDTDALGITANEKSKILCMEVPMR
ncbi:MAG: pirin family protein [Proteobacteria bacterium]|nr:pirin family protein [Pseudomonadota bacterium]